MANSFGRGGFLIDCFLWCYPSQPGDPWGTSNWGWAGLDDANCSGIVGCAGMGQEMNAAAGVGAYEAVVAYMLAISLVYSLTDFAFSKFEQRVLVWRP